MSVWTIREAWESDVDRLIELRLEAQKHHENQNSQIWQLSDKGCAGLKDRFVQLLSDREACVLVALDDSGTIVGMGAGQIRINDNYVPAISASIGMLFVSEKWRNQGIGTGIVRRLCQFFASRHVEDISLDYIVGNEEAIQFWEKLGFQPRMILAGAKLGDLEQKLTKG